MLRKDLAVLAIAMSVALAGCSGGDQAQGAPPPPEVTVATPLAGEVVDWDDFVGRFEAPENVEVKPRVSGYLIRTHFRDGQFVRRGQLLFTIDARPAQAQLDQARAQLVRAQAQATNARTELARSRTLAAQRAASVEEVEQRQAALRSANADVSAAQAALRARQLDIGFTRVTAPISGQVSQRLVDPGNAVTADQTVLTTVVSTNPLHFSFDGSEALLLRFQRQGSSRIGAPVRIKLQDEAQYVHSGRLDFVDNVLNAGSGTIRGRAIVPNPDGFLKPGMMGRLRLASSAPYPALMVPDTAIATDAARRVVYVVDKTNTVVVRPVQLGPLNGNLRVIRSGLGPQDQVIIGGIQRAMPGSKVKPKKGRIAPPTTTEPDGPAPQAPPPSVATSVAQAGGR
jgi:RND family efflux transporter MFP subunit